MVHCKPVVFFAQTHYSCLPSAAQKRTTVIAVFLVVFACGGIGRNVKRVSYFLMCDSVFRFGGQIVRLYSQELNPPSTPTRLVWVLSALREPGLSPRA